MLLGCGLAALVSFSRWFGTEPLRRGEKEHFRLQKELCPSCVPFFAPGVKRYGPIAGWNPAALRAYEY
jgi:hypothetical protein